MSLYSAESIRLRAEVIKAHEAMLKADEDLKYAKEITQDTDLFPDGSLARGRATARYDQTVQQYSKEMAEWFRHVKDGPAKT